MAWQHALPCATSYSELRLNNSTAAGSKCGEQNILAIPCHPFRASECNQNRGMTKKQKKELYYQLYGAHVHVRSININDRANLSLCVSPKTGAGCQRPAKDQGGEHCCLESDKTANDETAVPARFRDLEFFFPDGLRVWIHIWNFCLE